MQGDRELGASVRDSAITLARQLDDRAGLANVLMRAYWSRGTTPLDEILEMLTEAIALGEEMGDIEIQTEAIAWRVADVHRDRRSRLRAPRGRGRCWRWPGPPRSRS